MTTNKADILIEKLDGFIRKYYRNQLIKGGLFASTLLLLLFLSVVVLEYFGHYHSMVRAGLLYGFLSISLFVLYRFVFLPLSGLMRIGKVMSYEEASAIIGDHFPEVKDRLLNTLQLKQQHHGSFSDDLLQAAIEQKTKQLSPVPFVTAIDLTKNIRYARLVFIPIVIYMIIYLVAPGMISDGTIRVLKYNKQFIVPPPFTIDILNTQLEAEQFTDYTLEVQVKGKEVPDEIYLIKEGNSLKMQKTATDKFTYTFNSVREQTAFQFEAGGFLSKEYLLNIVARPQVIQYAAELIYPTYLQLEKERIENPGDLTIPAGTVVNWKFTARHADEIFLTYHGKERKTSSEDSVHFTFSGKFFVSSPLLIKSVNHKGGLKDSMDYMIHVIPDAYPTITIEEKADSQVVQQRYFIGDASDDHGLTKLTFNLKFLHSENPEKIKKPVQTMPIPVSLQGKSVRFYHQVLLIDAGVEPSDEVSYYFETWDNDGVHGPKSARSRTMTYRAPSMKELEQKSESERNAFKENMEESIREAKTLQKEMKALEQKMLEKKELSWEEKKKLEKLLERQKELGRKIDEIKQEQQQQSRQEQEYKQQSEEILKKQQLLDKMFNEIMDDEMKKLIRQAEQLMQQQNKDQIRQEMEKLELTNKDIEKELDQMLEHYKQLEIEKKMEDAVKKLDELSEKQKNLSEKSDQLGKEKKLNSGERTEKVNELKQEQQKLNSEFKDLQEQLKDIEQKNNKLEEPKPLENTSQEQKDIQQKQEESEEQLDKNKPDKSSEKQKEASDKMKEMEEKMKKGMEEAEEKELDINADALREILENTIQLSNDQEKLMEEFKQVSNYNPQYVAMAKTQKTIRDNARIIEDSLLALSKKVPELSSFVNKEVTRLTDNLDKSVEGFGDRNIGLIRMSQQQAMMNANNLGVMLSEILKQMQDQQSQKKDGKSGNKPKKGKASGKGTGTGKSMSSLKKMQEELNRQLREGLNKKDGKGDKPGEKQGMGSQEYARMAAQQMAIRQQMQKMLNQMGTKEKEGMGGNGKLQEMQRLMEQTEKELFNKKLSSEMIQRQEEILTRMLESEKAEKKQEQYKKREAEQAKEKPRTNPPSFDQYLNRKKTEEELLQTIPAEMQPYYKEKSKEYLNKSGQ